MRNVLQLILPFEIPYGFPDKASADRYEEWDKPARLIQISTITFLTASLYTIFTFLDKSWAPPEVQRLMWQIHMLVLVPMLLSFSVLAYTKRHYQLLLRSLTVFPMISMSSHAYIVSQLPDEGRFLTEGYLGIVWIFIVCGLPFRHALISASASTLILIVAGSYTIDYTDGYILHVFWLFCSFSFGFLGALIFDKTKKSVFLTQESLHRMAITDELTGAFNRNMFNQVLAREIPRAERYLNPFGLVLIDIDHFKSINDAFGHDVGDKVLVQVAKVLKGCIRENDTLVRWGGEEFVVIALEVDEFKFKALCNKLRTSIENEHFDTVGKITVSIGATLYIEGDNQNSLLNRSDAALYQAKDSGRNCVVIGG
jgi:diguanylate cyclase (GGDEF)-like protein